MDGARERQGRNNDPVAGTALAVSAALSVLVMAHHPTGTAHAAGLGRLVHGAMMALIVIMFAGFCCFAVRRGLDRFAVILALVIFAAAMLANLLAGTINGFVIPALLERNAYEENALLLWTLNQTFAKAAVFAISAAFALWGADLAMRGAGEARLLGAAGLIACAAPAARLAGGFLDMKVAGAFIIYAGQAAFAAAAGIWLAAGGRT
ncbi:MAG: hypothetical protein ACK4NP_07030 [Parvularculaceae bacterium]